MISVLDRDNCLFQISTIVLLISLLCLVITIFGSIFTKPGKPDSSEWVRWNTYYSREFDLEHIIFETYLIPGILW